MKISFKIRKLKKVEIDEAIKDPEWQVVRRFMKGKSLKLKVEILNGYYDCNRERKGIEVEVQVINYWNALKRAGIVK